tara:strand:- start:46863 stop:48368 length:1506 start_codon:yes stop_codon:yes gene_type:complete
MDIFNPKNEEFKKKYNKGIPQLLYTDFSADLHTPVSTLLKFRHEKYSFLFESVEKGNKRGRYSVIGLKPDLIWECKNNVCTIEKVLERKKKKIDDTFTPIESLKKLFSENKFNIPKNLPPMSSGLFGYLGYDMISHFENIEFNNQDDLKLPDSIFIRPSIMIIFDNVSDKLFVIKTIWPSKGNYKDVLYETQNEIKGILHKINKTLNRKIETFKKKSDKKELMNNVISNVSYKEFKKMVEKAKKYIFSGDIFQVVISRVFKKKIFDKPISIYRALRFLNPSPYLFYINFKNFQIVGSSPEVLVRLTDKLVTIRPIAGTRKRGKDYNEDKVLEQDLLKDPKEISEHLMLLDLGRNDISRVTKAGSVEVTEKMYIEYFSHVMHIVSNINGILKKNCDNVDALFGGFPAGTVTGAPKIRAMEIIEEIESKKRSIYAGGIGYLSANGNLDSCIALRTAVIKDSFIYIQAGAGIVADSHPKNEFLETENKALALLEATLHAKNFKY